MGRNNPEAALVFGRPAWCSQHQVAPSKSNTKLPKTRRAYFDCLHAVQIKRGEFTNVLAHEPTDAVAVDFNGFEARLHRRLLHVPRYIGAQAHAAATKARAQLAEGRSRSVTPVNVMREGFFSLPDTPFSDGGQADLEATVAAASNYLSPCPDPVASPASPSGYMSGKRRPSTSLSVGRGFHRKLVPKPRLSLNLALATPEYRHFAEWCHAKHLHLVCTWRKLDKDGNMRLSKREFIAGLKELQYDGSIEPLWISMDKDTTGIVSFLEFAPEHALDLTRFKHWATQQFGSLQDLFRAMDEDKDGKVTFPEFQNACQTHGCPTRLMGSISVIFLLLDYQIDNVGLGTITVDELAFLDKWKPPDYLWQESDAEARDKFKAALMRKHSKNPFLVWRKVLDKDGSMRVSYEEFRIMCKHLTRLGFSEVDLAERATHMYCAIDEDRSGWFTLKDWDEGAYDSVVTFVHKIKATYPKISAWVRAHEGEHVSLSVFRKEFKLLLGTTVLERLFEGLSLEPIIREDGKIKAGTITKAEVACLDAWDPEAEAREDEHWCIIASEHMDMANRRGMTTDDP